MTVAWMQERLERSLRKTAPSQRAHSVTRPTPTLLDQAMRQAGCTDIQINMTMDVLYHLPGDE